MAGHMLKCAGHSFGGAALGTAAGPPACSAALPCRSSAHLRVMRPQWLSLSAATGLSQMRVGAFSGGAMLPQPHMDSQLGTSRAAWAVEGPQRSPPAGRGHDQAATAVGAVAEPPAAEAAGEDAASGVTRIFGPGDLEEQLSSQGPALTVLMCKAHSCRPCKMFSRKFQRLSEAYPGVAFLEIFGDDSKETRGMMISLGIKVTPTFRLYRNGDCIHKLSGINETNLRNSIEEH